MNEAHERQADTEALRDLTGTMVGRFAVRARLGKGGMGEVYRADDTKLKRPVALKRISPHLRNDDQHRRRFLREAERASRLSDQHIAGIYDVLEEKSEIFLVMEYVEGQTLRQRLAEALELETVLETAVQCVRALGAAHEQGLVHHDIKPENIMLTPSGRVKVLDFGVARELPHADFSAATVSITSPSGVLSGTLAYMAPEVLLGKDTDGRADIFSLGVVFYEALAGHNPFVAGTIVATTDRILHETPLPPSQLNPKVPLELDPMVLKMLAKDPAERYSTARDLLSDLLAAQQGFPVRGSLGTGAREPQRRARWRVPIIVTGFVLAACVGLGTVVRPWREKLKQWISPSVLEVPSQKSLAVLPFSVVGGDAEAAAFSDGLSETLSAKLTELAASHSLQVVPASEVRTQGVKTADQARREFGVNLVLAGSLHRSGDVVRVTYALVDARARRQLRAGTITVRAADVFALEDQVVQGAVHMLDLEVRPEEREALAMHGTQVASAYDLYLQGRGYLQNYHKPEDVEIAINVLKRALELDPRYALAYAGLGEAYWRKYDAGHEVSWLDSAREACGRAVKLDTKLAAAHICLGTLASRTGLYDKAVEEFQRAVGKEPGNDDAYRGLASAYEDLGKLPDAERTYRRAIELHPSYWAGYRDLAAFYYRHGRYSEAEKQLQTVLELTPDNVRAYTSLGGIYHLMGKDDDAVEVLKKSLAIKPTPEAYTNLGTTYYFQGRYREAVPMMEKAVEFGGANYKLWGNLAEAYYRVPELKAKAPAAYTQALQRARKQLSINSKDGEAWAWLAVYSVRLGKKDGALGATEQARRLAPGNVNVLFRAALVYELAGDRGRALKALESAVKGGYSTEEIRTAADLAELRKDPRYQRLMTARTSH